MYTDKELLQVMFVDANTLACPLMMCRQMFEVPDVPISDALGEVFGMSGETLARIHGEQELKRTLHDIRRHLEDHTFEEWLPELVQAQDALKSQMSMWSEMQR